MQEILAYTYSLVKSIGQKGKFVVEKLHFQYQLCCSIRQTYSSTVKVCKLYYSQPRKLLLCTVDKECSCSISSVLLDINEPSGWYTLFNSILLPWQHITMITYCCWSAGAVQWVLHNVKYQIGSTGKLFGQRIASMDLLPVQGSERDNGDDSSMVQIERVALVIATCYLCCCWDSS